MATISDITPGIARDSHTPNLFARIWTALCDSAERHSRRDQIVRLEMLSDQELADRGIRRDDIARHVYRDLFYT